MRMVETTNKLIGQKIHQQKIRPQQKIAKMPNIVQNLARQHKTNNGMKK